MAIACVDVATGDWLMGSLSPIHWIILAGVLLLLFGGGGKLSGLMGDAAKGIRAFRDGLKGEENPPPAATPVPPLPRTESEKDPIAR
jgi:sec-independent protein translocase protein TatA